jgi:hypothetical protein
MPDRDALGFMATMQGEYTMAADRLDREARDLEREAAGKRAEASAYRQRADWMGEGAEALMPQTEGDVDD